jgi:RNA polymerase sigma-70 factor (ECF subfamily)
MTDFELSRAIDEYRAMVFRIAYGYVKDVHDADDIAQDVFFKLCRRGKPFESEEYKKAWLIRVAVNRAKSVLTSSWKKRITSLEDADKIAQLSDESLELHEYIEKLKPKYRTIIYLFYYENYSVKETAEILGIRESAVTTQLNRARGQLKTILLEEGF